MIIIEKIKKVSLDALLAILIFSIMLSAIPLFLKWSRSNAIPEEFFSVVKLYISDYEVGQAPIFTYDRVIRKPFSGDWTVKVQKIEGNILRDICVGQGHSNYKPENKLPPLVTMEWYLGKSCPLSPGNYRIWTIWIMHVENYPDMSTEAVSNVFNVKNPSVDRPRTTP